MTKITSYLDPLPILTAVLMGVALWLIFIWVPTETNQGAVQRILYFHVPIAWGSMLGIFVVSGSSFMYLLKKNEKWDRLAVAAAEVGVVFGGLMLLSGMIWARPVWAVWWTGEAKLTTALILFFIYVAYLMFRAYFPPGAQRQRLAAIIGLIGAIDTPIIYFAANLWSQAHPPVITGPAADSESSLGGDLGMVLLASTIAFTFLFIHLVQVRYNIRKSEDHIVELKRSSTAQTAPAGGLKLTAFSKGRGLVAVALIVTMSVLTFDTDTTLAQSRTVTSGIVVGVEVDDAQRLARFAVSDSSGNITTFEIDNTTEYGLENQAGDRWVSTQGEEPVEAVRRLRDHRERFAPITVSSANGIATSVVEREEGKLESNLGYLFAVFIITWILFFAYVLYMGRKQRVLQHEIARLRGSLNGS